MQRNLLQSELCAFSKQGRILGDHSVVNDKGLAEGTDEDHNLSDTTAGSEPEEMIWDAHTPPKMGLPSCAHERVIVGNTAVATQGLKPVETIWGVHTPPQMELPSCAHERVIVRSTHETFKDPQPTYTEVNRTSDHGVCKGTPSTLDDLYNRMVLFNSDCDNILDGFEKLSSLQMDNANRIHNLLQENRSLKAEMSKQQEKTLEQKPKRANDAILALLGDNDERVLALMQENASLESQAVRNCDKALEVKAKENHERLLGLLQNNASHRLSASGKNSNGTAQNDSIPQKIAAEPVVENQFAYSAGDQAALEVARITPVQRSVSVQTAAQSAVENEDNYPGVEQVQPEAVMILPVQRRSVQNSPSCPKNSKAVRFNPKDTTCSTRSPQCRSSSRKSPHCRSTSRRSPQRASCSVTRTMTRRTPRNAAASQRVKRGSPTYDAPCWPASSRWRP